MQLYTSKHIPLSMRHAIHFIPHENAHQEILTMKISSKLIFVIGIMCPNYEHPTHHQQQSVAELCRSPSQVTTDYGITFFK